MWNSKSTQWRESGKGGAEAEDEKIREKERTNHNEVCLKGHKGQGSWLNTIHCFCKRPRVGSQHPLGDS